MTLEDRRRADHLVDAIEAIVWEIDGTSGAYLFVNAHAERLLGHPRERWLTEPGFFLEHVHGDDREKVAACRAQALVNGTPYVCDYRMLAADDRTVWLRDSARVASDDRFPRLQGLTLDLTETKALESQLARVQKTEILGRLASGVAHDFNNLLMAMTGYSDIVLHSIDLDHVARPHMGELARIIERGVSLVRQLLSFSRKQDPELRALSVNTVVEGMAKMLRRLIGEDIRLTTTLEKGLGLVRADVGQLEQVLMNLAVNARDAMPLGGQLAIQTESAELGAGEVSGLAPGHYVALRVRDTGCGMDASTLSRVFQPFFTTKEAGRGTGLGLSIVERLVRQNGGVIRVESARGKGSCFEIYLPRLLPASLHTPQATQSVKGDLEGSETLLIVEDDEALREALCESLRLWGYTVLQAGCAREALAVAESHREALHLVVTDVVMPDMSGPDLARLLGSLHPEAKVVYMSGHSGHPLVAGLLEGGRVAFLEKPFRPDELARHVRKTLRPATEPRME